MGKIIYAPIDLAVTVDSDQDIWIIAATAAVKNRLHGWELFSPIVAAETVNLRLLRRSTLGTGGTGLTEVKRDPDQGAIVSAATSLVTTPGTPGDILQEFEWEQLGPLGQLYTPELRPESVVGTGADSFIALNLQTALAGTTQWKGWVAWEEI